MCPQLIHKYILRYYFLKTNYINVPRGTGWCGSLAKPFRPIKTPETQETYISYKNHAKYIPCNTKNSLHHRKCNNLCIFYGEKF